MFHRNPLRRHQNRRRNSRRNSREHPTLRGVETLESKQMLTALHVNPFDDQPDDRGCGDLDNECNTIVDAVRFASSGDDIVLRPGMYHENVVLNKSVDINSVGGRSTIRPEFGPVAITIGAGVSVTLRNLDLTGGVAGLEATGTEHLQLFDVRATENALHGLLFDGGQLDIHQGEVSGNGSDGIVLNGGDLYMVDTIVEANHGHGVIGQNLNRVELDNPRFESNHMAGAVFDEVETFVGIDVRASRNVHDGLHVNASGTLDVLRSWFDENGGDGLFVANAVEATKLTDVTATGNELNGVHLKDADGPITITGGRFESNGQDGINLLNVKSVDVKSDGEIAVVSHRNGGHGLAIAGASTARITGDFRFNAGDGISAQQMQGELHVADSFISENQNGVVAESAGDVELRDSTMTKNREHGVEIQAAADVIVVGGAANQNQQSGIVIGKADAPSIAGKIELNGTQAAGNTLHGVHAQRVRSIAIQGGYFSQNKQDGIHIDDADDVQVELHAQLAFTANENQGNGLSIKKADDVSLVGREGQVFELERNQACGVMMDDIGKVATSFVSASTNAQAGVCVSNALSFADDRSSLISNENDGLRLRSIDTDVVLNATTSHGNDSDDDKVGAGVSVVGVGGTVSITDGTFERNPFGDEQIHGVSVKNVDGNVVIRESKAGELSASNNSVDGIRIENVGTSTGGGNVTIGGGEFAFNGGDGLVVSGVSGRLNDVRIEASRAHDNGKSGARLEDIDGDVTLIGLSVEDNRLAGVAVTNPTKSVSVAGSLDVAGGNFSRRVGSTSNQLYGLSVDSPGGEIEIDGATFSRNTVDGLRIRNAARNVTVSNATAARNTVNGFLVDGADQDVAFRAVTAPNNGADGFHVLNVSASGLATDFKVTVEDSDASGNGSDGIFASDVERVLVEDTIANGNGGSGVFLIGVTDDVAIKRSETNNNAVGIRLEEANDVNLQFSDAKENAADGLLARDGSTVHATGGSFSNNGISGWYVQNSGDVLTFATTFSANSEHGLELEQVGAVSLATSSMTSNGGHGFKVEDAASLTLSSLQHVRNLGHSFITSTPAVRFVATTGEDETRDNVSIEAAAENTVVLRHTRTVVEDDGVETSSVQDPITIVGVGSASLSGGDGMDVIAAKLWSEELTTGLTHLLLEGNEQGDQFEVASSMETTIIVEGVDPEIAPGDRLLVHGDESKFVDDGESIVAEGFEPIRYSGIESLEYRSTDSTAPTVVAIEATNGPNNEITLRFSESITGLDLSDFELWHDDAMVDLSSATLATTDGGTTWSVGNLRESTTEPGSYRFVLSAVDSAIEDLFGNRLAAGDFTAWDHVPGDSDGDGKFDTADLIAAFASGKYESGSSASYAEGDWDGDGSFDSSDLIFVFSNGKYQG